MAEPDGEAADPAAALAQTAQAMYSRNADSKLIDLRLLIVRPGYARLTMCDRPDMVNGHHIGHGGYLFTFADSTFAYACNSYNRNAVASACHIDVLRPAREGEVLEAECEKRSLSGRTGVYDTTIRKHHGQVIALFRSKSYRIAGEVIAGLEAATTATRWRRAPRPARLKETRMKPWRPLPVPTSTQPRTCSTTARNAVNERSLYL